MKARHFFVAAVISGLVSLPLSAAAESTWDSTWYTASCTTATAEGIGNSYSCGGSSPTSVTVSAFSTTSSGQTFAAAALKRYSGGFGVETLGLDAGSPEHSLDNHLYTDAILVHFGVSVALTSVDFGWTYRDKDVSVLAYTGDAAPTLTGNTTGGLVSPAGGWDLVGNYSADPINITNQNAGNALRVSSSWWLISAYNSAYTTSDYDSAEHVLGTPALGNGSTGSSYGNSDFVKVFAMSGNRTPSGETPEPTGVALLGLGLLGLMVSRRRLAK